MCTWTERLSHYSVYLFSQSGLMCYSKPLFTYWFSTFFCWIGSFYQYIMCFSVSCYSICFKVFFVWNKNCYPSFLFLSLFEWNIFFHPLLSDCIFILICREFLVSCIKMGLFFFIHSVSLQSPYITGLKHLVHLCLK